MTVPYNALYAFRQAQGGGGFGDPNQYPPGMREFLKARDPVNQAREMEIFLRLQQTQMDQMRNMWQQINAPTPLYEPPAGQGVSVGPMSYAPGQFAGQQGAVPFGGGMAQGPTSPDVYADLNGMSNGELVSRAKVLGVDNAEKIPADALKQIIAARRQDIRPHENVSFLEAIPNAAALAGISGAQGLVSMATHVLNAFDTAAQFVVPEEYSFRKANKEKIANWLSGLDEGVRANIGPDDQRYGSLFGAEGSMLAYAGIGNAIFKGVGAVIDHGAEVFPAIGRLAESPMGRGAIQGLATALGLDAGSDKPWLPSADDLGKVMDGRQDLATRTGAALELTFGNRLVNGALGAVLGGLGEHLYQKQLDKYKTGAELNAKLAQDAQDWQARTQTTDAEWYFVDEQGQLGRQTVPAGRLGPGSDYAGGQPESVVAPQAPTPSAASGVLRNLTPQEEATATTLVNGVPEPVVPVQTEYIGPERQLAGPPTRYAQGVIDQYVAARNAGSISPELADRYIDFVRRDPARWIRRTGAEIAPEILALKNEYAGLSAEQPLVVGTPRNSQILDRMYEIDAKVMQLLTDADLSLHAPEAKPNLWETIRATRESPATPSRDLVNQVGTAFRTPAGDPLLMFHGTGVGYEEIDPTAIGGSQNLVGPGFYATSDPTVAGGNPLDPNAGQGYGDTRAMELQMQRLQIEEMVRGQQAAITAFETQGPASGVAPEAYASAKQSVAQLQTRLQEMPLPAPNVRPFFVAGTNFWNVDQPMSFERGMQVLQAISENHAIEGSEWEFGEVAQKWGQLFDVNQQNTIDSAPRIGGNAVEATLKPPTGKNLYDLVKTMRGQLSQPYGEGKVEIIPDMFGASRLNETLANLGFDGIEYEGGMRAGGGLQKHRAVAIFDPKNVVPAFISGNVLEEHASRLGVNIQKIHEVMDSPILDHLAQHSVITDADVAAATAANNPGGLHIVRGVEDMKTLLEGLMDDIFKGSYDGLIKAFRPALHPSGRFDVIVSSLGEVTDDVVASYKKYGVFKGMDIVMRKSGKTGIVTAVHSDGIQWRSDAQIAAGRGRGSRAKHGSYDVAPNARQFFEAPELYQEFRGQVLANIGMMKQAAGQNPQTEWIEPLVYQNLSKEFEKFAAQKGIGDPALKAALYRFFDAQYVNDVKGLNPEAVAKAEAVQDMVEQANDESTDGPDLHLMAKMKGFDLTTQDTGGFILHDQLSTQKFQLDNEEAVANFLATAPTDRVPNVSPSNEVPAEAVPQYGDGELHSTPREEEEGEQLVEDILAAEDLSEEEAPPAGAPPRGATSQGPPASGGGGGGRQPPSGPPSGNAGQGGAPQGPQGGRNAGALKRVRRSALKRELDQEGVYALMHRHQRQLVANVFSPMRVYFANMENDLARAGANSLRPWKAFDNIVSGMDVAHNETFQTHEDASNQMQRVGRKALRNGSWARMWLMEDRVQRALYSKANKFSNNEIDAMAKLDNIIIKMHNDVGEDGVYMLKQFKDFVRAARANHEAGQFGDGSYPISQFPNVGFFGEQAQSTRLRFESIDPRRLVRQYIKAWGFNRHVGAAWQDAQQQWRMVRNVEVEGNRPFTGLADKVLDWMDFVKRGPEPGKELAVKIVNRTLRFMGVPLTFGETRALMQGMQNSMYMALQGWRVHVIVRDSTQPILAAPTTGYKHLGGAYKTAAMIGSDAREAMKARAYEYGVTQHRMPRVEGTGIFEAEGPDISAQFNPLQRGIRAVGQFAGDVVRDATPRGLRQLDLSVFGPLGLYTREGEWNRIIVGQAAYTKFGEEWQNFQLQKRIAAATGDMSLLPSTDQLIKDLNADSFRPAITRSIREQIEAGNIEGPQGAMGIYMRALADRTQFTYGGRHAPMAIRTTGARMGYALGNWSSQGIALAKELSAYGSPWHKLAAAATFATVTGLLELAHRTTGYNFRTWEWWQSLLFTGSPILKDAISALQTVNAAQNVLTQDRPQQESVDLLSNIRPVNIVADAARMYNPAAGAIYSGAGIYNATQSPAPVNSMLGFLLTGGTRGAATEYERIFEHPVESGNAPVPVQTDRTDYPEQRLPGANQFKNTDSLYGSMMRDMVQIQRQYQPGYMPPVPTQPTDPNSLGKGKGAF